MSKPTEEEFLELLEKMQRRHEFMIKFGLTCMGIIALCFACFD